MTGSTLGSDIGGGGVTASVLGNDAGGGGVAGAVFGVIVGGGVGVVSWASAKLLTSTAGSKAAKRFMLHLRY